MDTPSMSDTVANIVNAQLNFKRFMEKTEASAREFKEWIERVKESNPLPMATAAASRAYGSSGFISVSERAQRSYQSAASSAGGSSGQGFYI